MRKLTTLVLLCTLLINAAPLARLRAESGATITLAVPEFQKDLYTDAMFKPFEDAHPGVTVSVVSADNFAVPAANDVDKHLAAMLTYASAGDVLYVDSNNISPEDTNAGYFLDLSPLVNDDKSFKVSDFYPAVWRAFQWDQGIWALPSAADPILLSYDPDAFDKAGVPYPNDKWTIDDLADAVRKLTQKDANGKIVVYGLDLFPGMAGRVLLGSLTGAPLFDSTTIPNTPHLTTPEAEKIISTMAQLDADGLLSTQFNGSAPLDVGSASFVAFGANLAPNQKRKPALLAGGKGGLDVQGFAVSAGTQHPDLAYALANYLVKHPEAGIRFALSSSLQSQPTSAPPAGSSAGVSIVRPNLPPELKKLVDQVLANGYSLSDLRYNDYLLIAFQKMKTDKLDAKSALQAVEAQAVKNQQTALAKKGTTTVAVVTPVPEAALAPGKIALKFGMASMIRPMPNQAQWDDFMRNFAASDPQVGKVDMENIMGFGPNGLSQAADTYDCFYLPYNAIPGGALDGLLNVDPYLSADSAFDKSDVVGNVMAQLQRDGKIWGVPVNIEFAMLRYNADLFSKAGVPAPTTGWTAAQFTDALKALKPTTDAEPFDMSGPGGIDALMLIAAYGGLPFDFRTDPPTVNLTDPATIEAIRQVLDLVKGGYIKYQALSSLNSVVMRVASGGATPIISAPFGGMMTIVRNGAPKADPYKAALYPTGTAYNAVSYSIGTAYISAKSQNPDACYRWISQLARRPDLFSAMPARHSLINDPAISAAQGPDVTAVYNQFDALLKDPHTVSFPSLFQGGQAQTGFFIEHWLFVAFDNYVLHDADLDTSLKQAQTNIKAFQECVALLPPFDASSGQNADYGKQYLDCAVKIDSSLQSLANNPR